MTSQVENAEDGGGLSNVVQSHYNNLEEKGLKEREKSRIVHMRNFNNWIKSNLIRKFMEKSRENMGLRQGRDRFEVLDIGAGKGGDLIKWSKGEITHIVMADIANVSLEQAESRYRENRERHERHNNRDGDRPYFTAEFLPADCTRIRLKDHFKRSDQLFDLVSCQFTFHYSFESLEQAKCMIRNASECLRPGGYFIGTTPDSYDIVRRVRESGGKRFGNDVFFVEFDDAASFPLFGAKYNFHLEGVVDCPEFLVYFPAFVELAKQYGLELVYKKRFEDFFDEFREDREGNLLLKKMTALEGTLSKAEWEAVSLYVAFAFVKKEDQ